MPSCCPYSVAPLLCMSNQREKSPGFEPRKPLLLHALKYRVGNLTDCALVGKSAFAE